MRESPFHNGTKEKHNKILFEAVGKTLEVVSSEPVIMLAWDISAKNSLQNKYTFNTKQLVSAHTINDKHSVQTDCQSYSIRAKNIK